MMYVDIGTAVFAFGIFALALRNYELAVGSFCVGVWLVA